MGDRCYLEITIRKADYAKFCEIVLEEEPDMENWNHLQLAEDTDGTLCLIEQEANWGWSSELQDLVEAGVPFVGYSGAGDCYGASRWCSIDGKFHEIEATESGFVVPVIWENGAVGIEQSSLDGATEYFQARDRANDTLGIKEKTNDGKEAGNPDAPRA